MQRQHHMQKITPEQQKLLKACHVLSSGLWLSCVIMLALLPILSERIVSDDGIYIYNLAYHFIDMSILTPAAVMTLVTGLVYSIFTKWGFFKHGWLVYKWIVTLLIIITGTFYLGPMTDNLLHIAEKNGIAALHDPYYVFGQHVGISAAIINSLLLIVAVFFSIYKPWNNMRK